LSRWNLLSIVLGKGVRGFEIVSMFTEAVILLIVLYCIYFGSRNPEDIEQGTGRGSLLRTHWSATGTTEGFM
jgi:hypothetical protein